MMRKSKNFETAIPARYSPKTAYWLCLVSISLLIIGAFLAGPIGSTSLAQQSAATAAISRNAALVAATSEVLKETSQLRQLTILRTVQSSTQSRAEIERTLIKNLDEEMSPPRIHAAQASLVKLGLVPPDFRYRDLMIRLLTEQVAGYYDPKTQWFHLADWIELDGQRPIMAHELTHALQDQHFNLRRFDHWPKGDSDAELAAHALIEGDATLAMALYVANNPLRALAFLKSLSTTGMPSEELNKAPRALRETLLFPYQEGEKWARAMYKQGGWPRISKAFEELPQSTEQILHPEKYFAREAPTRIILPDLISVLNAPGSGRARSVSGNRAVTAWRHLDTDVNGEWGTYLQLDQFFNAPAESRRAAAGWSGDRFSVYEGPSGEILYVSLSIWDTENDAREFFEAYSRRTELRYPEATPLQSPAQSAMNSEARAFSTVEGSVAIERRGARVLVIEGLTAAVDPKALKATLWR